MAKAAAPREVAARWTPDLVKEGWTPISDFFLRNYHRLDISSTEAILIVHLMSHKWDSQHPYPGFKSLAERMGVGATQIRSHARKLQMNGLLKREFRTGTTNRFDLTPLFRRLEALRVADRAAKEEAPPLPEVETVTV